MGTLQSVPIIDHAIIFGVTPSDTDIINSSWALGFIKIGSVTSESCRYVTDYVLKKYNGEKALAEYGDKQIPFRICSNGLGKSFVISNLDSFIKNNGYFKNGVHKFLPRYYRDVIYETLFASQGIHEALRIRNSIREFIANSTENIAKQSIQEFMRSNNFLNIDFMDYYNKCQSAIQCHRDFKLQNIAKGGL